MEQKLYETLNQMIGGAEEEEGVETFTPEQTKAISEKVTSRLQKKLGDEKYKKLEEYMVQNQDNEDLKELVDYLLMEKFGMFLHGLSDQDPVRQEVRTAYSLLSDLHKKLDEADFDAEQALLDYM